MKAPNEYIPRDRSLSAQPISIQKAQSRKKSHKPLHTSWIAKKCVCHARLINIQSCYFDYRINKPFTCFHCVICVSCSVHSDLSLRSGAIGGGANIQKCGSLLQVLPNLPPALLHRLLRSQHTTCAKDHRLFILITHKAMRSVNPIIWF